MLLAFCRHHRGIRPRPRHFIRIPSLALSLVYTFHSHSLSLFRSSFLNQFTFSGLQSFGLSQLFCKVVCRMRSNGRNSSRWSSPSCLVARSLPAPAPRRDIPFVSSSPCRLLLLIQADSFPSLLNQKVTNASASNQDLCHLAGYFFAISLYSFFCRGTSSVSPPPSPIGNLWFFVL